MAKAGRPKKKNDLLLDLEGLKQAVRNVVITATDTGNAPSIIDFVESEHYLGLPVKKPTPIDLYPMQRIMLKAFYSGSIGNEDLHLTDEEIELCKNNNFEDEEVSDIFMKKDNGKMKSELVLVWGRRCLSEDNNIVDINTNKIYTFGSMWDSGKRTIDSWTYNEKSKMMECVSNCDIIYQGIRDVYKVQTYNGHFIEATSNHPVLTSNGWKQVKDLDMNNDMIAISESFPFGLEVKTEMTEEQARLIGYMIGDENCSQAATFLTCSNKSVLKDFKLCLSALGDNIKIFKDLWTGAKSKKYQYKVTSKYYENESLGVKDYRNRTLTRRKKNLLMQLLVKYGVSGKTCHHKRTPKEILEAPKNIVSNYLKALFSCDGSIYIKKRKKYVNHCQIEFCTVNKQQAYDVQYLLSKFGILSNLRLKSVKTFIVDEKHNKRTYNSNSYVVSFVRKKYISIFLQEIGFIGKDKTVKLCESTLSKIIDKDSNHDSSLPYSCFNIRSIEHVGKKRTFDLQVSDQKHLQNFVSQGFICHNSGKDFIVSILACYEAAKLLESPYGDPYRLYNLGSGAPFTILTVANSSTQAQVLFNEIKDKIINSNYFADKIIPEGILSDQIHLLTPADKIKNAELEARGLSKNPGSVIIRCGHSNSDSLAGISCYCLLLDEIGLYKQTAGSSGGESIYRTLAPATATYVRKETSIDPYGNKVVNDIYDGKIICISSPRGKEGIFYDLYRKSSSVSHRVMCKLPTWIVNPTQTRELLREKFSNMTEEEFMMEFGGEFSGTAGQTFFTRDMVEKCFYNNMKLKDHGESGFSYFCHLDPATSSHNYALCVCHREMFLNPETHKTDFKVVVDHLKYWQPLDGKPILNEEVDNYIINLSRKFNFEMVTFDQWNSQHSIDHLRKHSIPAKMTRFTKRYKIIIYDNLYDLASASRIQIPNHDLLRDEMLYLQRRYTPTGYRVFAKKDGLVKTDDVVDALAGAAYACMHETFERLPQGLLVRMGVNSMTDGVVFRGMQGIPLDSTSQQRKWSTRF